MKCEMCHSQEMGCNEHPNKEKIPINTAAVSGVMETYGGFANLEELLSNDEAHFWLNGYVNKQNYRIWSETNPVCMSKHRYIQQN
ncbi:hypothetical protein TNCV_111281 [Trichonephila clavipes]|nr:hypothetical protein TNCV_111281 [Trichonephila clavipes]